MTIRLIYGVVFMVLVGALIVCGIRGFSSNRKMGNAIGWLEMAVVLPMIGNTLIIGTTLEQVAVAGYYIYFVGMDLLMASLVLFTSHYCKGMSRKHRDPKPFVIYAILLIDGVQTLLNPYFGHSFTVEKTQYYDYPYYKMIPFIGHHIHHAVIYFVFLCVIGVFIASSIKTTKLYRERYLVVLILLGVVAAWQSFYIFTEAPMNNSMVGFGIAGLILYYLSMHYRPLRLLDRLLSDIVSGMSEALFVYDDFGRCLWMNKSGRELLELKADELESVHTRLTEMFGEQEFTNNAWTMNKVLGSGENERYFTIENHNVQVGNKHLAGSFLVIRDNTEENKRIKREFYNSTHDSLTGLYTKQYLYQCISNLLHSDTETAYSAVFVDVKNFKIVNDIFGTDFGDLALKQISDWLRTNVDDRCRYGRIAGDTFGLLMPSKMLEKAQQKVENELLNFVVTDGSIEHRLLIHVGIYEVDDRDLDVSVMFDRAHLALSQITGNYKKHFAFYDKELRNKVVWDQQIAANLTEAISSNQITPYLQPITNRDGKVVGAEALARWMHPEKGFLSPAIFIPILEKNGLIVEVDRHIWRCACEILSAWKKQNDNMFISVNISPKDFYYIDVVSEIKELVREYDIAPEMLRIEITETVMMNDVEEKFKLLDELRSCGFIVEMDDFGSGYSSLNLLKDMPVDVLKIDMKFLSSSENDEKAQTIIRHIIKLTEDLHITSLTEGVETRQQYSDLSEIGCKLFQGYYFAKPMPRNDFEEYAFSRAG